MSNLHLSSKLYAPIKLDDISVSGKNIVKECVDLWIKQDVALVKEKMRRYGYKEATGATEACNLLIINKS